MRLRILIVVAAVLSIFPNGAYAVNYIDAPPLNRSIATSAGNVGNGPFVKVPLITWGGDIATILANGNASTTAAGSIFERKGLKIKLFREDDFKKQVEAYMKGETPYLRGTMGMVNMAAEVLARNPSTKPVVIYELTWSNGGDCLVVKPGINTAKGLKGKTICLQAFGPHVDYLAKILSDAGLSMRDVVIKWTKDLTGTENSPAEAFQTSGIDAAMVIIPDGLMLTSNGTVGTGAEDSVKGAKILLSTKTANRIISDVYAVRSDYLRSHRRKVQSFVHGLMLAEQQLHDLFKNKERRMPDYKKTITAAAQILLDSPRATGDTEALYGDCEYVGFQGNVKFFGDKNWPRHIGFLTEEIQTAFITLNLLGKKVPLEHAQWDYNVFRKGLKGTESVPAPKFIREEVARVISKKQALGTLADGELFNFEINFQPNQNDFSEDLYKAKFKKVVDLASTYGGAIITIEGNSDPHKYNKLAAKGTSRIILTRTKQAAKNLSINRALAVRESIIKYAGRRSVPIDESQFSVIGNGITQPKFPLPKTKEEWLGNMRVVFRIIQVEAESSIFEPLN